MASASDKVDQIFWDALQLGSEEERDVYLDQACGGDQELRRLVKKLLRAQPKAAAFLEQPFAEPQASGAEPPREGPGALLGPYKLLEQIGEGGFGVVFMAEQLQPVRRKVALKILKPGMDTRQVVGRFEAERQALAIMDHPNIAKVFDGGSTAEVGTRQLAGGSEETRPVSLPPGECPLPAAGRPYFVMELVKGVPITEYCDQHHLTPRQRLELFIPVCQAVQHAHHKGIIHRDLKPSNVLVTLHDTTPVPKIIDFGIAKALGQELTDKTLFTGFAQMIGTPLYMSPEQAGQSGLDIDTRSDIYSLGVLLYELLTGTTPFDAERFKQAAYDEIRRIIRDEDPPKPSTRLSELSSPTDLCAASAGSGTRDVPTSLVFVAAQRQTEPAKLTNLVRGELDWIVMKALEKERNRRYETANDFAMDLQHYLADEPVQACPPSMGYRLRKFARRNKRVLVSAALLVVVLLMAMGAVAGTIGWAVRDRDARAAAIEQKANLALLEAESLLARARHAEALSAARRAEELLASGRSQSVRARVQELRSDLEMVLRLDEIRLPQAVGGVEVAYDNAAADSAYAEAFRKYGIDVDSVEPTQAAELIRAKAIRLELTVALDNWARKRRFNSQVEEVSWKRLIAVARAADPDEWRNQVRDALEQRKVETLIALAASPKIGDLPLQSLSLLGEAIQDGPSGVTVLRQAQEKYPGDFDINFQLAWTLERIRPPRIDEAVRFYTVAKALRPRNIPVRIFLGNALRSRGELDEALAEYRKAVELQPDAGIAHHNIGVVFQDKGQFDDAIAAYQEAVRVRPASPFTHLRLAWVFKERRDWDQTILHASRVIALKGDEARARSYRGHAYLNTGQWHNAAVDLAAGLSSAGLNDAWTRVACLRLLAGDRQDYQALCREVAQRMEADPCRCPAYYAARVCSLSADSPIAASQAVRWGEAAAYQKTAWHLHAWALAHYRAGQFEDAIRRSEESLQMKPDWRGSMLNWPVLAMAHQRLGRSNEATQWLDKAVQWRARSVQDSAGTAGCLTTLQAQDWLEFLVLFAEAKSLVKENGGGPAF